jgi:hypothetical protein
MQCKTIPPATLYRRSYGLLNLEKYYTGSTKGGMALSSSDYASLGRPVDLSVAHTWTNEKEPQIVIWILKDPEGSLTSAEQWTPGPCKERTLLTIHKVLLQSWEWFQSYFLWITTYAAMNKLSHLMTIKADLSSEKLLPRSTLENTAGICKRALPGKPRASKWVKVDDGKEGKSYVAEYITRFP